MKIRTLLATCVTGGMLATSIAYADHASPMGAGWANMPNDIHNTRLEDTQEEFMDLVRYGGGADSVNRYDDDTTTTDSNRLQPSITIRTIIGNGINIIGDMDDPGIAAVYRFELQRVDNSTDRTTDYRYRLKPSMSPRAAVGYSVNIS